MLTELKHIFRIFSTMRCFSRDWKMGHLWLAILVLVVSLDGMQSTPLSGTPVNTFEDPAGNPCPVTGNIYGKQCRTSTECTANQICVSPGTDSLSKTGFCYNCTCVNGVCANRTSPEPIAENDQCQCESGWTGQLCDQDVDECTSNTHNCTQGTATCSNTLGGFSCPCCKGYKSDDVTGTCTAIDECEDESPCDPNASCSDLTPTCDATGELDDDTYSCACNAGYDGDGVTCCANYLGSSCTTNNCLTTNAECAGGKCQCKEGFFADGQECKPKLALGGSCKCNDDCATPNAYCGPMNTCTCKAGYFLSNGACTLLIEFGQLCTASPAHQCKGEHTTCKDGKCDCELSYTYVGDKCVYRTTLNGDCSVNEECTGQNVHCVDGKCKCLTGFLPVGGECKPSANIGGQCSCKDQCKVDHSFCEDSGLCACETGYYAVSDTECAEDIAVDQPCDITVTDDNQCDDPNAECIDSVCECQAPFKSNGNTCVLPVPVGGDCSVSSDCGDPNAYCDTTCTCKENYVPIGGVCTLQSVINGQCTCNSQCSADNAVCSGITCECEDGFYFVAPNTCTAQSNIGGQCTDDSQCKGPNAVCSDTKCKCATNYVVNNAGICELSVLGEGAGCVSIGGSPSADLCGGELTCINNVCSCPAGYTYTDGKCYGSSYGQPCSSTSTPDTTKHIQCVNGLWICQDTYVYHNGACVLNQCASFTNPCPANSICVDQCPGRFYCQCNTGYTYDTATCNCELSETDVQLGGTCKSTDSCAGGRDAFIRCDGSNNGGTKICECVPGYDEVNGVCVPVT